MDPYAALGVERDASKDAIRRAYRGRAKRAHPDGGGSEKQFALVKHAHDILTDDIRRAHYDQTGETEDVGPDITQSLAMQMISAALDEVLGMVLNEGRQPEQDGNLLTRMINVLNKKKAKATNDRDGLKKAVAINEKLKGRFKRRKKEAGEAPIEALLRGRINVLRGMEAQHTQQIKAIDEAISIINAHAFSADPVKQDTFGMSPFARIMQFSVG